MKAATVLLWGLVGLMPLKAEPIMNRALEIAEQSTKIYESFSPRAYPDPADGRMLIGYGFDAKSNTISKEVATLLLRELQVEIVLQLHEKLPFFRELSPVRQSVLIEMAYQMGIAGLMAFKKTLLLIEGGSFKDAAAEMLDSKWAREDSPARASDLSDRLRQNRF